MSSDDEAQQQAQEPEVVPPTPPKLVEYDPVTGVPSEFNEFLPKDSEEYKRWKAAQEGDAAAAIAGLALADGAAGGEGTSGAAAAAASTTAAAAAAAEKKPSKSSKKKAGVPQVVLETNTRNKKKCVTSIHGLDTFK